MSKWVGGEVLQALAYDVPIPGYKTKNTISLHVFRKQKLAVRILTYFSSMMDNMKLLPSFIQEQQICAVLYPGDATEDGKLLRLKQQFFLCSASFQAISMVKKTPAYKNRLRALELERNGGVASKKKGHKQIDKKAGEDLEKELDLQIKGAEKPSIWGLLGVQFVLMPYTLSKLLLWSSCWFWRYQVRKAPYTWDDACYLTRRSLRVPLDTWINTGKLKIF